MSRHLWVTAGIAFGLVLEAIACRAPTPHLAAVYPDFDLIAVGTVASVDLAGQGGVADVQITEVVLGDALKTARLRWWQGGGGMCAPTGCAVETGEQVVVYFQQSDTRREYPYFANLVEAAQFDPLITTAHPDLVGQPVEKACWTKSGHIEVMPRNPER